MSIAFYSTNNKNHKVNFESALLSGLAPDYGLYMIARSNLPKIPKETILSMKEMTYSQIAFAVLKPFLIDEIPESALLSLLDDAYGNEEMLPKVQKVTDNKYVMWLTNGPTYSFKDYAARFFARALNYFLAKNKMEKVVLVATSGDTGGAIASSLHGLSNVKNIVFFPKGSVSDGQRKQMTTLQKNIFAFEVNGDFDVCQALAKALLNDKQFALSVFKNADTFTSANSISLGRLLPQAVYPFFAYSRIAKNSESIVASVPSGNFGDILGTILAKEMGLPISKIVCGVNENAEFSEFMKTCKYEIKPSVKCPSSAMIVSHPSNLARLIDFYGGHMFDECDSVTKKVVREGVIDVMPNMKEMCSDIFSISVDNQTHYETIKQVYDEFKVILDPHGAVGWKALQEYSKIENSEPAVVYETADPGKFPDDVNKAIGIIPPLPKGMKLQEKLSERIYSITSAALQTKEGLKLSDAQVLEAKEKISAIFK